MGRSAQGSYSPEKLCSDSSRITLELYRKRTGGTASVSLNLKSSLSIQPFEGIRFVRGGRYGISIDFGLEVVEKKNICGANFKSKFIDLNHEAQAHNRLITRDRRFGNKPNCNLIVLNEFNGFGTTPRESHLPQRGSPHCWDAGGLRCRNSGAVA